MPYEIWRSLNAKEKLQTLEQENQDLVRKIWDELNQLSVKREDFITGSPERLEVFIIDKYRIYYRILHRLKIIDIIDIVEVL